MKKSFSDSLRLFNSFIVNINSSDCFSYKLCYQHFFNFIRSGCEIQRSSFGQRVLQFSGHFILSLISFFTFFRFLFKKNIVAHYLIDSKNNNGGFDRRSKYVINIVDPIHTINFLHSGDLKFSCLSFYKKKNALYHESLLYFYILFIKIFNSNACTKIFTCKILGYYEICYNESLKKINFFSVLIKTLKIKKFIFVDDSRHITELLVICNKLGIETHVYMHARFNKYHVGLTSFIFTKYYVWSDYFKSILLEMNANIQPDSIVCVGHPEANNQIISEFKDESSLLVIGESNISYFDIEDYFHELEKLSFKKIYFRDKPGSNNLDFILSEFPRWIIDNGESIGESLINNKIGLVIGTHSTVLMESWLYNVPSIVINSCYDYCWHLVDEEILRGCKNPNELVSTVKEVLELKKDDIYRIREFFWKSSDSVGSSSFTHILNNFS